MVGFSSRSDWTGARRKSSESPLHMVGFDVNV